MNTEKIFIRAEIQGELPSGQKVVHLLANNADGFVFCTDEKSIVRPEKIENDNNELIALQLAEFSRLQEENYRQKAELEELTEKLECLLCHATGSKLSKSTYTLKTMETAVNDEIQECCEEARAEVIKEFLTLIKAKESTAIHFNRFEGVVSTDDIESLAENLVGNDGAWEKQT